MSSTAATRHPTLSFMALFLSPCGVLAAWFFQNAGPRLYLAELNDLAAHIPALRFPLVALCLSGLAALALKKWQATNALGDKSLGKKYAVLLAVGSLFVLVLLPGFAASILRAGIGVVIVIAAVGIGLLLCQSPGISLQPAHFNSPLERGFFAAVLGFGFLALMLFVLGSLGLLAAWFWWLLIFAALLASQRLLNELGRALRTNCPLVCSRDICAAGGILFIGLWFCAHLPLIWSTPLEYDVLEYHLAAPAHYLREGRISFLHENIYATFPENGEMLYLLAMILSGSKWHGLPGAHVVLLAAWMFSVCGVYLLVKRLAEQTGQSEESSSVASVIGALLYATVPLGTQMSADFYVEHFQSLFHMAALLAGAVYIAQRRDGLRASPGWLVVCGCAAGFACGTKYTAMLFTLLPLACFVPLACLAQSGGREALRALFLISLCAMGVFMPWLLRNMIAIGDPIYPLGLVLQRRFFGSGAVPDRIDHFEAAHRAGEKSFSAFVRALAQLFPPLQSAEAGPARLQQWMKDIECGPHLLGLLPAGLTFIKRPVVALTVAVLLIDLLLWFFFSHRLNRFMYPLLAPLAALAGLGAGRLWLSNAHRMFIALITMGSVILLASMSMLTIWLRTQTEHIAGSVTPQRAASMQLHELDASGGGAVFDAYEALNTLPQNARVLFIGDAQTFFVDRTPAYSVVFNPSLLEDAMRLPEAKGHQASAALQYLAAQGITHLFIHYPEWFRLDRSYALQQAPGKQKWQLAVLDPSRRTLLRNLLNDTNLIAYQAGWPEGVHPAYLKLDAAGYAALQELLRDYTAVEKTWSYPGGLKVCEVRRLLAPQTPGAGR